MTRRPGPIQTLLPVLATLAMIVLTTGCSQRSTTFRSSYELAARESIAFRVSGRDVRTTMINTGTVDLEIRISTLREPARSMLLAPGAGPTGLQSSVDTRLDISNSSDQNGKLTIETEGGIDHVLEQTEPLPRRAGTPGAIPTPPPPIEDARQ